MTSSTARDAVEAASRLRVLLSRKEIAVGVERLAGEVRQDYGPLAPGEARRQAIPVRGEPVEPPLVVGVLKGAFVFMADLVRALNIPVTMDFVRVSSYGSGTTSSGQPRIIHGVRSPLRGRHVLVVEDIVDMGITTRFLRDYLQSKGAASVKLCALLSKPSRRQVEVDIDYLGFTVPDLFVVGYGLDFDQQYRHLPDICVIPST